MNCICLCHRVRWLCPVCRILERWVAQDPAWARNLAEMWADA